MSRVDVLIPTYNPKAEHLSAALVSLLQQSFKDWSCLIHDDCSSGAEEIVRSFLSDSRIRFERSAVRLGIGGNWNACVAKTSSPYVAFLFQDDLWYPEYLKKAIEILDANPSVGFVSMEHEYKVEGGPVSAPLYDSVKAFRHENVSAGLLSGRDFLKQWIGWGIHPNVIGEPSFVVIRRSAMEKAGKFLEDMPQFLDSEYWLRLLLISDWFNETSASCGAFRVHAAAASAQNQQSGTGLLDRLRCFERLVAKTQGDDRRVVITARNKALGGMVEKFFMRVQAGGNVAGSSKKELLKFCLVHPFLMCGAILRYLFSHS